jgi:tRNA (mo5U34)-methyltransferase
VAAAPPDAKQFKMNDSLASEVAAYQWFHSIDLGGGVVTPGRKPLATCIAEAQRIFDRIDLTGRSVLDVGAWNGFFSFEAKRRGAVRVLATDSFCWQHPEAHGRATFDLARQTLGLDIEAREIDVSDLAPETVGEFDVVLYLGVFYHRYDAIDALAKVARLARELLVVETRLDLRGLGRPAMVYYPGRELGNDPTNWWGPNEACVEELLRGHGFGEIESAAHPFARKRAIFHAWRSTAARRAPLPESERLRPKLRARLARKFRRLVGR